MERFRLQKYGTHGTEQSCDCMVMAWGSARTFRAVLDHLPRQRTVRLYEGLSYFICHIIKA